MASFTRRGLAPAATLALLACGGGEPLEVVHNQAPVASTCELSDRDTGDEIPSGTFDVVLGDRSSYLLTPLVRNDTGDAVTITHARVHVYDESDGGSTRLSFACTEGACNEWDLPPCGETGADCPTVPAGGTTSFEAPILPRVVTVYYQGALDVAVASGRSPPEYILRSIVHFEGESSAGASVALPAYEYVLRFCLGCLVRYPAGSDSAALPGPDCCGTTGTIEAGCLPGQDDPIDCRACTITAPEICNFGRTRCT